MENERTMVNDRVSSNNKVYYIKKVQCFQSNLLNSYINYIAFSIYSRVYL